MTDSRLDKIYRRGNVIEILYREQLIPVSNFMNYVINHSYFKDNLFDENITSPEQVIGIIELFLSCAKELFDTILFTFLKGRVDSTVLFTIATACLAISIKFFGTYDWIYTENVFPVLISIAKDLHQPINPSKLDLIEKNILVLTDGKACLSITDLYNEDLKEMLQENAEYIAKLIFDDGKWYLRLHGEELTPEKVKQRLIKKARVIMSESLIEDAAESKNLTRTEAINWLEERVLKYGFGLSQVILLRK